MLSNAVTFAKTDTELYVPAAALSTKNNAKILQKLKSGFKMQLIGININQKRQYKCQTHI